MLDNTKLLRPLAEKLWEGEADEYAKLLTKALAALPDDPKKVIKGMNGLWTAQKTAAELAAEMKLSEIRILQLHREAKLRLKEHAEIIKGGEKGPTIYDIPLKGVGFNTLRKIGFISLFKIIKYPPEFYSQLPGFKGESVHNLSRALRAKNMFLPKRAMTEEQKKELLQYEKTLTANPDCSDPEPPEPGVSPEP